MTVYPTATVAEWLRRIIGHEGGMSLDPTDDGNWTGGRAGVGELRGTKYGISAAAYPDLDIQSLTEEQAAEIYVRDYLEPILGDGRYGYPDGVAYQLLDFAVNSGAGGVRAAIRYLQNEVGLEADGVVGPKTRERMREFTEAQLVMAIVAARLRYMTDCRTWNIHGRGWVRRMADNLLYGVRDVRDG